MAQVAEFVGGITGRELLGSKDANQFLEDRRALKKNFPALIPTILRAAGEVGALSEQEQQGIRDALNAALPGVALATIFAKKAQVSQFRNNLDTLRTFLGVIRSAQSGDIDQDDAREQMLALAQQVAPLEG